MEVLLKSQIQGSCRLALPDGLQELMCDISREGQLSRSPDGMRSQSLTNNNTKGIAAALSVFKREGKVLRAQPRNINAFITNYLSALLVTRENLTIAANVCREACDGNCCPELEDELRDIGIFEDDIEQAKDIIVKYFNKGVVKEKNLLMTLMKETHIFDDHLPAVQDAIRRAFRRHQKNHSIVYESSSESGQDEVALAVNHTLQQYRKTRPSDEVYNLMAEKIQSSYRAYGVTRARPSKDDSDVMGQKFAEEEAVSSKTLIKHETVQEDVNPCPSWPKTMINTVSSTSLAGSYLKLPKYVPYSALDSNTKLMEFEEVPEREHTNIVYNNEYTLLNEEKIMYNEVKWEKKAKERKKRISFDDVKNKTVSAASINSTEGFNRRSFNEVSTEIDYIEIDHNGVISTKMGEREDGVSETSNISQYNNEQTEIDNGESAFKDLGIYNDYFEVVQQVLDTENEDIEITRENKNIDDASEDKKNDYIEYNIASDNGHIETDSIDTESDDEDTEFDNKHFTTDKDIVEADNESDLSIEEVIKMSDINEM